MEQQPDLAKLKALSQTPAGRKLFDTLRRSNGPQLRSAAQQAQQGDYTQAQQLLSSLLSNPEALALLRQLEDQL